MSTVAAPDRSAAGRVLAARWARGPLTAAVVVGTATGLLVIAQAALLATIVAGAFVDGDDLGQLGGPLAALLAVVAARAALAWAGEVVAQRSGTRATSRLRRALVAALAVRRPSSAEGSTGEAVALATSGIDAVDAYFARYLPQLVLAVVVPLAVLVAITTQDWVSGLIVVVTLPVIPVFMALIGAATRSHSDRRLQALQGLSGRFLDAVRGLPTLKVFGRADDQRAAMVEATDRYRRTTTSTLRLAFLSSLTLELLASVAVALVAVSVGLRLLDGHLDLRTALFVLVLAPEAYLPLRALGTHFHASTDGMSAAAQIAATLEARPTVTGRLDVPDPARSAIEVDGVRLTYPDRRLAALDDVSLRIEPGELLAICGPSGCGKSTLLALLLGLAVPDEGTVRVGGVALGDLDGDAWRSRVAWVPQRPHLFAGTVADNVRLGRPEASDAEVWRALNDAGLHERVTAMPRGIDGHLGERGAGWSAGERQRLALARALVRASSLLLADEPTAHLDGPGEAEVVAALRRQAGEHTVVVVTHRPELAAAADRVVTLSSADWPR